MGQFVPQRSITIQVFMHGQKKPSRGQEGEKKGGKSEQARFAGFHFIKASELCQKTVKISLDSIKAGRLC
ncbi:hypothetical protein [Trichloromonas sp.]|uniref:hypothetical protein n=1 Tax=Trichloromonas sp. TaxID=3069249 RepID=UPI003D8141BE